MSQTASVAAHRLEARLQPAKQLGIAPDPARVEQTRSGRPRAACLVEALVDPPHEGFDPNGLLPERIADLLRDLRRRELAGVQAEQLDFGLRRQVLTAVGAQRDE
jgi:hypothetical protein